MGCMGKRMLFFIGIVICLFGCGKKENPVVLLEDNYRNYYEIFVYSFYDSNGDGIGDIKGVIEKLDYINDGKPESGDDLGCDGIWLMPVMPSTTYHKYDVVDYYDINPEYGTLDDFKELVKECDKRGIKLIIDLVFNHTSTQNQWFLEASSYLEGLKEGEKPDASVCPYVEYYHFTEGNPGSGTYYQVGASNWYYEAVFWDGMPDLALENDAVRKEIERITDFWLELGVGGFRLDASKEYFTGMLSKNIEVLSWYQEYVKSKSPDAYVVAEVWDSFETIEAMYESKVTSMFNFPLAKQDGKIAKTINKQSGNTAESFAQAMVTIQERYGENNPEFIDAPFLANHDMSRAGGYFKYDEDKMKMAAGLLFTMNGSPFVYYGEEIGMISVGTKDESKRIPFLWSSSEEKGMTKGPKDMETAEAKFPSLEEQKRDENSLFHYYRRAIRIRNENPEIARGTVSVLEGISGEDICAVKKVYKDKDIIIVYNISTEEKAVDVNGKIEKDYKVYSGLTLHGEEIPYENSVLKMPPYSIAILRK